MHRVVGTVLVALVTLALGARVLGQPPTLRPPGACVPVPRTQLHLYRSMRQASPPDPEYPTEREDVVGFGTTSPMDLDSDGAMDFLVPEPSAGDCVETMHLAIYLTRGGCGHRLGVIVGALDLAALSTAARSHGLPDLRTTARETVQDDPRIPAVQRTHQYRYRFDGSTYVEASHVHHDAVCHHCGLQQCRYEVVP